MDEPSSFCLVSDCIQVQVGPSTPLWDEVFPRKQGRSNPSQVAPLLDLPPRRPLGTPKWQSRGTTGHSGSPCRPGGAGRCHPVKAHKAPQRGRVWVPRSASLPWISATRSTRSTLTRGDSSGEAEAVRAGPRRPPLGDPFGEKFGDGFGDGRRASVLHRSADPAGLRQGALGPVLLSRARAR